MTCESKSYAQKLVQQSPLNPMQKVCYLHLGFHKTATTSFQLTLQKNRKQLKQAGIYLPKLRGKKQKFSANHSGQIRDVFAKKSQHLWDNTNRSKPPRDQQQQAIQKNKEFRRTSKIHQVCRICTSTDFIGETQRLMTSFRGPAPWK